MASWRPHPADRVCQRGTSALEHLLNCILGGVNFQPNDRVLLVQVGVGEYAEMAHAVLNKMVQGTLPLITFKGFYINMASDIPAGSACLGTYLPDGNLVVDSSQLPINQIFLKRLMEEWWERQPEAGPREMPTTDRGTLLPPTVRLCSWSGEKLIIPSMLRDKFPLPAMWRTSGQLWWTRTPRNLALTRQPPPLWVSIGMEGLTSAWSPSPSSRHGPAGIYGITSSIQGRCGHQARRAA